MMDLAQYMLHWPMTDGAGWLGVMALPLEVARQSDSSICTGSCRL
jgi:hypothetical protein